MLNAKEAREIMDSVLKKSFNTIEEFIRISANAGENSITVRWINEERTEDIKITSDLPVIMTTTKAFENIQRILKENEYKIKIDQVSQLSTTREKANMTISW